MKKSISFSQLNNSTQNTWLVWAGVLSILVFEFILFRTYVLREIVDYYPQAFDQASYLTQIYSLYNSVVTQGWTTGLKLFPPPQTVPLFSLQAVAFFILFGASRFNALLLNFLYFVILQIFLVSTIRSISKNVYLPFIMLGFLLTLHTPFIDVGGIPDFRVDSMAFCAYGLFVLSVIRSEVFLIRKWIIVAIIVACLMFLLRTITAVYLLGTLGVTWIYFLIRYFFTQLDIKARAEVKARIINLLVMGLIIFAVIVVYIWMNKDALYNYYIIGHLTGQEKNIRAAQGGVTNLISNLWFYPKHILFGHLCVTLASIALVYALFFVQKRMFNNAKSISSVNYSKDAIVFLLAAIFVPIIVLTLDMNKSGIVGGIVIVPLLWLTLWPLLLGDYPRLGVGRWQHLATVVTGIVMVIGVINVCHYWGTPSSAKERQNMAVITKMYDDIGNYAVKNHWSDVRLSLDFLSDQVTSGGITVLYYERWGHLLPVAIEPLGGSIFAIDKAKAMESLKNSNVVILTMGQYPKYSVIPFVNSIKTLAPLLHKTAEKHFVRLGDYVFQGNVYRVYVANK